MSAQKPLVGGRRPGRGFEEAAGVQNLSVARRTRRRWSEWHGRVAEVFAAIALLSKGYRILARRQRSRLGEIDLIAVRGRRLAFVEVKMRGDAGAAEYAVSSRQAARMAAAAERWVWRGAYYRGHAIGLDSILVVPWRWPRHCVDALQRA